MQNNNTSVEPETHPQLGSPKTRCSQKVLEAIYGSNTEDKKSAYENSLRRWWSEYAERKNHEEEEEEHVCNSLLYDRNHLPRTAPAPDCVHQQE